MNKRFISFLLAFVLLLSLNPSTVKAWSFVAFSDSGDNGDCTCCVCQDIGSCDSVLEYDPELRFDRSGTFMTGNCNVLTMYAGNTEENVDWYGWEHKYKKDETPYDLSVYMEQESDIIKVDYESYLKEIEGDYYAVYNVKITALKPGKTYLYLCEKDSADEDVSLAKNKGVKLYVYVRPKHCLEVIRKSAGFRVGCEEQKDSDFKVIKHYGKDYDYSYNKKTGYLKASVKCADYKGKGPYVITKHKLDGRYAVVKSVGAWFDTSTGCKTCYKAAYTSTLTKKQQKKLKKMQKKLNKYMDKFFEEHGQSYSFDEVYDYIEKKMPGCQFYIYYRTRTIFKADVGRPTYITGDNIYYPFESFVISAFPFY